MPRVTIAASTQAAAAITDSGVSKGTSRAIERRPDREGQMLAGPKTLKEARKMAGHTAMWRMSSPPAALHPNGHTVEASWSLRAVGTALHQQRKRLYTIVPGKRARVRPVSRRRTKNWTEAGSISGIV